MHHDGPVRLVVLADVLKREAFGQIEVPLHRAELPEPADGVFDLEIDLRAVKGRFTLNALVIDAALVQGFGERALSRRPVLFRAEPLLARVATLDGQLELDLLKAERPQDLDDEIDAVAD